MTLQNEEALLLYQEAATDLESAVSIICGSQTPPTWLRTLQEAQCHSWDYPKLAWHNLAWKVNGTFEVYQFWHAVFFFGENCCIYICTSNSMELLF